MGQHENRGSPETGQLEQLTLHDKGHHEHEFLLFSFRDFVFVTVNLGAQRTFCLYDRYGVLRSINSVKTPIKTTIRVWCLYSYLVHEVKLPYSPDFLVVEGSLTFSCGAFKVPFLSDILLNYRCKLLRHCYATIIY